MTSAERMAMKEQESRKSQFRTNTMLTGALSAVGAGVAMIGNTAMSMHEAVNTAIAHGSSVDMSSIQTLAQGLPVGGAVLAVGAVAMTAMAVKHYGGNLMKWVSEKFNAALSESNKMDRKADQSTSFSATGEACVKKANVAALFGDLKQPVKGEMKDIDFTPGQPSAQSQKMDMMS